MLLEPHGLLRLRLRWSSATAANRRASSTSGTATTVDDRSTLSVSPIEQQHKALTLSESSGSGALGSPFPNDDHLDSLFGGLDEDSCQEEISETVTSWNGAAKMQQKTKALLAKERVHQPEQPEPEEEPEYGEFVCKWENCERERRPFKTHTMFVVHVRKHTGEKPHRCTFEGCTRSYTRMENLKTHLRLHKEEKLFTCEVFSCGKSFSNATTLERHYDRAHPSEQNPPFECELEGGFNFYADPSTRQQIGAGNNGKEANKRQSLSSDARSSHQSSAQDDSDEVQSSITLPIQMLPPQQTIKQALAQQQLKEILNNAPAKQQPSKSNNNRPLVLQQLQDAYEKQQSTPLHLFPNWTIKKPNRPVEQKLNFDDDIEDEDEDELAQMDSPSKRPTSSDQRRQQQLQDDFDEIQRLQSQRINKYLHGQQKLRQVFDSATEHSPVLPAHNDLRGSQQLQKKAEEREAQRKATKYQVHEQPRAEEREAQRKATKYQLHEQPRAEEREAQRKAEEREAQRNATKYQVHEQPRDIGVMTSRQNSPAVRQIKEPPQHLLKVPSFMSKAQSVQHLPSPQPSNKSTLSPGLYDKVHSVQHSPRMQQLQNFFDKAKSMQHLSSPRGSNNKPSTIGDELFSPLQNSAEQSPPAASNRPSNLKKPRCVQLPHIYFERTQSMQQLPTPPPASEKPNRRKLQLLFDEEQFDKDGKRTHHQTVHEEETRRSPQKSVTEKTKPIRRVQSERTNKPRHQRVQQIFNEAPPLQHSPSFANNNELRRFQKFHNFSADTNSQSTQYQTFQRSSRGRQQELEDIFDEVEPPALPRWSSQQPKKESTRKQQRQDSFDKPQSRQQIASTKGVVFSEFAELEF